VGITARFHDWLSKINQRKQGTIIKSIYFSQIIIKREEVESAISTSFASGTNLTINEWKKIASQLNYDAIPHSWFIIRELYIRYELEVNGKKQGKRRGESLFI
jgi:hypothetical protein